MSVVHTAAVARRIGKGREDDYEEWLQKVVATLRAVPGYDGMTVVTSPDPRGSVRTMLIRFHSTAALSDWENSPQRLALAEQADQFSTHYYQTAPGIETFFAVPSASPAQAPPRWKMCLLTIPTVYLLVNVVLFILSGLIPGILAWPVALRMLPVTSIMTVLLTYVCLPALSKVFAPWLFSHVAPSVNRSIEPSRS
jgi:antibiotic biosynthesis monooxygenase (ABM) superfamily enzyme